MPARVFPKVPCLILIALLVGGLVTSCHEESAQDVVAALGAESNKEDFPKVLIVGIDGATFSVLDPLIEAGRVPNLARLIESGARGNLRSEAPIMSPRIWTTMVTGKSPDEHGITGFLIGDDSGSGEHLMSSLDRKVPALWNIATVFQRTVGFHGWLATWPAEKVDGYMISDRAVVMPQMIWYPEQSEFALTYPEDRIKDLERLRVTAASLPVEDIIELVPLNEEEQEEFADSLKPQRTHGLSVLKWSFASQRTHEKMIIDSLEEHGQPDLMGVFLVTTDTVSHTFWHHANPDDFDGIDREKASRLGVIVDNLYAHNDLYLGEILSRIDPNTVILVVSDHGFQSSGLLPKDVPKKDYAEYWKSEKREGTIAVGQSGKHHLDGIFIASGYPIRKGVTVDADIYDIAPTILALLGLPNATDMKGEVLREIFEPSFLEDRTSKNIDSYDDIIPLEGRGIDHGRLGEEELVEQLRSLGYVQ